MKENANTEIEQIVRSFQNNFETDKRLFSSEIAVNYAYCDSLFEAGVLTRSESEKIKTGLQTLSKRAEFDRDYFNKHNFRNITEFISERLVQLVGEVGKKINIGRSVCDLSSTVLRYWLKDKIVKISQNIHDLQRNFVNFAEENENFIFFAKSRSKKTLPILLGHWCLAYFEIFARDRERLDEVWRRTNTMPLGSSRGSGTSFEIDREELARKLKFEGISSNSLDAVNDGDFILEFVNVSSLIMRHFQQLIEDLLFYSSENIRFFTFENKSSVKLLQIIRGKCLQMQGLQTVLNTEITGLSSDAEKYSSDRNEIIFKSYELLIKSFKAVNAVFSDIHLNKAKSEQFVSKIFISETEIFEYLFQREISYEQAEEITRKIAGFLQNKTHTSNLALEEFKEISPVIEADILEFFDVRNILANKNQIGGTSPERVSEAVEEAKNKLKFEE